MREQRPGCGGKVPKQESIIFALLIFAAALLIRPYHYLESNQALQIPLLQTLRDPSLYPNDPFVRTLAGYCSIFWLAVAYAKAIPLPALLFALFLLTTAGGLLAAGLLAGAFFPTSRLAPWAGAVLFALGINPILGGGTIVASYTEHTTLAVVFLLLAFWLVLKDRPYWWAICFALGFMCNPMYGVHALPYFLLFALFQSRAGRRPARPWLYALALAGALILPSVVWALQTTGPLLHASASVKSLWYQAAQARLSHHLFPMTWSKSDFARFGALVLVVAMLARSESDARRPGSRLIFAAICAACLWVALSFVAAHLLKSPAAISLQAARGGDLFCALAAVYMISFCSSRYETSRASPADRMLSLFGMLGSAMFWRPYLATPVSLLLLLPMLGINRALPTEEWDWRRIRTAICVGLIAVALLAAGRRVKDGRPFLYSVGVSPEIRRAAAWASANTPRETVFLVDPFEPEAPFFRPLSQRSLFVTWKDGSAMLWDAGYAAEFAARLKALGMDLAASRTSAQSSALFSNAFAALDDSRVLSIGDSQHLRYALLESARPTNLTVVYRNDKYKIVRIAP